jgi:glycosyltransferase involved in cell wall biosynthesis
MTDTNARFTERPILLNLLGCFSPSTFASGPNQAFLGLSEHLAPDYVMRVIAEAEKGETSGKWVVASDIPRLPLDRHKDRFTLVRTLCVGDYQALLLNGVFDQAFTLPTLLLRRARACPNVPAILFCHGELSPSALSIRAKRKSLYLEVVTRIGLFDDLILVAENDTELGDIRRMLPTVRSMIIPQVRRIPEASVHNFCIPNKNLRVAFVGRVTPIKNLMFALMTLSEIRYPVEFSIFGEVEDADYWRSCRKAIDRLPNNIKVKNPITLPFKKLVEEISQHNLLFNPSFSENFGHAILESLAVGTPVLIGDRTPWTDRLSNGGGWSFPLSDRDAFISVLQDASIWTCEFERAVRRQARRVAEEWVRSTEGTCLKEVFRSLLKERQSGKRQVLA